MTIENVLTEKYGPLLSMVQLATVLNRSPEGLRIGLRSHADWSDQINAAKLRIGRRIYFRTEQIAQMLSGE